MAELDTRLPLMGTAFRPPDTYIGGALRDAALLRRTHEQSQDFWVRFNELRRTLGEQEALRVLYRDVYGQPGTPGGTAPPAAPSPASTLGALPPAQTPGTAAPDQAPALALEDMPVGVPMDVDQYGRWKLPGTTQYGTSGEVGRGVTLEAGTPDARPAATTMPAPPVGSPAQPSLAVDDPRRLEQAQAQRLTQRDPSLGAVADTLQPRVSAPGASPTTLGSLSPVQAPAPSTTATPAGDRRGMSPGAGSREAELIRRAYMISPAAGQQAEDRLYTQQTRASGQEDTRLKQAEARMAFIGQVADGVLAVAEQGGDVQTAYDRGLQTLEQSGIPTSHLPRAVDLNMVRQYSEMGRTAKERLTGQHAGLTPIYGTDAQGNTVLMQMTQSGKIRQTALPPGVTLTPGVERVDLGTEWGILDKKTGQLTQRIPKDVAGKAYQEHAGGEQGKEAGTRPERTRQTQTKLATIDANQTRVLGFLDEADQLIDNGTFTTGFFGNIAKGIGGTDARRLAGILRSIGSNLGLQELLDLKAGGGGLGSVTEAEHALLQSRVGAIDQAQAGADLKKTLADIRQAIMEGKRLRDEAYKRDFVDAPSAPGGGRASRAGGVTPGRMTRDQFQQVINAEQALAQRENRRPRSYAELRDGLMKQGWQVEQ